MILTGSEIAKSYEAGDISISPFNPSQINPNSYNYRLSDYLKEFQSFDGDRSIFKTVQIPEEGYVLKPRQMYLGCTYEIIGSAKYATSLIGRSSLGRLGLFVQLSANLGHTSISHRWTLEIFATVPIRLYPNMIIGQVSFWANSGDVSPYTGAYGAFNVPQESLLRELNG